MAAVEKDVFCKSFVLIETYWNVNASEQTEYEIPDSVLIETYWNVNVVTLWI